MRRFLPLILVFLSGCQSKTGWVAGPITRRCRTSLLNRGGRNELLYSPATMSMRTPAAAALAFPLWLLWVCCGAAVLAAGSLVAGAASKPHSAIAESVYRKMFNEGDWCEEVNERGAIQGWRIFLDPPPFDFDVYKYPIGEMSDRMDEVVRQWIKDRQEIRREKVPVLCLKILSFSKTSEKTGKEVQASVIEVKRWSKGGVEEFSQPMRNSEPLQILISREEAFALPADGPPTTGHSWVMMMGHHVPGEVLLQYCPGRGAEKGKVNYLEPKTVYRIADTSSLPERVAAGVREFLKRNEIPIEMD